jgi:hypothetical protein
MSHEEPIIEQTAAPGDPADAALTRDAAADAPSTLAYEPIEEEDDWLDGPEELPRRPRRRLLAPVPVALLAVLVTACGFIAGVLVEKGQTTSSGTSASGAASIASRFAAVRGGSSGASGSSAASGLFSGSGGAGATTGSVAFISGSTLYVTTSEGNTVKVTTSPASTVTKTVKAEVKGIHPGETVVVTGPTGANGSISAESIRVGSSSAGGGGLSSLFGGGSGTGRAGKGSGSSGEPALFGGG